MAFHQYPEITEVQDATGLRKERGRTVVACYYLRTLSTSPAQGCFALGLHRHANVLGSVST